MLARVTVVALLPLLGSPSLAHAGPEKLAVVLQQKQLKLFAIVYRSAKGALGEVRLNDMPLCTFNGEGASGSTSEAQGWLVAGTNRVDINIDKVPADGDEELALVSLHGLDAPGFPEDENQLWKVSLKRASTKPGALSYTFELPEKQAPPAELWKKAAVFTALTDADKDEVAKLAKALLTATQKGSVAELKKLFAFSMAERARVTYTDPKEMVGIIEKMAPEMRKTFAKGKLAAPLEYQLVGGGRVVIVTSKGKAPIVVKEKDGEASMPIHAAKIDGVWALVQ